MTYTRSKAIVHSVASPACTTICGADLELPWNKGSEFDVEAATELFNSLDNSSVIYYSCEDCLQTDIYALKSLEWKL